MRKQERNHTTAKLRSLEPETRTLPAAQTEKIVLVWMVPMLYSSSHDSKLQMRMRPSAEPPHTYSEVAATLVISAGVRKRLYGVLPAA